MDELEGRRVILNCIVSFQSNDQSTHQSMFFRPITPTRTIHPTFSCGVGIPTRSFPYSHDTASPEHVVLCSAIVDLECFGSMNNHSGFQPVGGPIGGGCVTSSHQPYRQGQSMPQCQPLWPHTAGNRPSILLCDASAWQWLPYSRPPPRASLTVTLPVPVVLAAAAAVLITTVVVLMTSIRGGALAPPHGPT